MNKHLTDGELRAAHDGEADSAQLRHLEACSDCQTRQEQLLAQGRQIARQLAFLAPNSQPAPTAQKAWSRLSYRISNQKENSMFKRLFAFPVARYGAAALLILALILAFPGTRALAGELLNLFRVQQVTVIPMDFTGLEQLTGDGELGNQFTEMISKSMEITQEPGNPQEAADAAEASQLAGFSVRVPDGMTPSGISVTGAAAFSLTVDQAKAQALLDEAGRSDLVLPDAIDGARIGFNIPSSVSIAYGTCPKPRAEGEAVDPDEDRNASYPDCVILAQIPSPVVNAPAGVDVTQLAQLGLEFTGMTRDEAVAFTSTVDWTSTLVVPIPRNAAIYKQIEVDGVTGTLIQRAGAGYSPQYALLWVKDGIIYVISGLGENIQQALDMASSLK